MATDDAPALPWDRLMSMGQGLSEPALDLSAAAGPGWVVVEHGPRQCLRLAHLQKLLAGIDPQTLEKLRMRKPANGYRLRVSGAKGVREVWLDLNGWVQLRDEKKLRRGEKPLPWEHPDTGNVRPGYLNGEERD
ncbi:MAG: hypothetical protein GC129_07300 [Proteobacteria bacterium]|nr:hypothetical protein [Pseudomonadota bacterium]